MKYWAAFALRRPFRIFEASRISSSASFCFFSSSVIGFSLEVSETSLAYKLLESESPSCFRSSLDCFEAEVFLPSVSSCADALVNCHPPSGIILAIGTSLSRSPSSYLMSNVPLW